LGQEVVGKGSVIQGRCQIPPVEVGLEVLGVYFGLELE